MTAPRSSFLLLLIAACLALTAGPAFAEPVETPPAAPPAGAADELPDRSPPEAPNETAPTGELPAPEEMAEVVETMKALPGRLPSTDGPAVPSVIGKMPHDTHQMLSAWRLRLENVVTNRSYVGRVVDQHPDAGATLAPGEVVTLIVGIPTLPSRGHTFIPPIERLTLEEGVAALRKQGFDIMLRVVDSRDGDRGVVLAQAPRPASVAPRGSRVIVLVGKGGLAEPVEPVEPPAEPYVEAPPAGPPSMPEGIPPGAEPPAPDLPEPPAVKEPIAPPAEEPPTPPAVEPPAEEPPTPPMPPAEEPPLPFVEDPPAPIIEEPPVPLPVVPPKPRVVLRVPTLVGPATGETCPRAFGSTFQWRAVSGGKTYELELQVEAQDGSWSTASTETVEGTSFRPKRMEAGRYRWRVRALADEVEGEWSEFRRLYLYGP